ncbi:hypothetical protein S40293_11524 [Stachybotrys chartarum IBT 40293]|nr:hypothetical protein S40293_11524 [Stachybotrys chartarum IBT 40293]
MFEPIPQLITLVEVSEAPELRRTRQQRLREISDAIPTLFEFNVPLSLVDRPVLVKIEVKPIIRENSLHPLYDIQVHCKSNIPNNQVDELADKVQEIYDTYIHAVRWRFGRHWYVLLHSSFNADVL